MIISSIAINANLVVETNYGEMKTKSCFCRKAFTQIIWMKQN